MILAALLVTASSLSYGGGKRPPKWVQQKTAPPAPKKQVEFEVVVSDDGELAMAAVEAMPPQRNSTGVRRELEEIYSGHNPQKLEEIDALLEKYAGREALLLSAVQAKYLGFASGYKPPVQLEQDDDDDEVTRLVEGLPQTAFDLVARAEDDENAENALKSCVAALVAEGEVAQALSIAGACRPSTSSSSDKDDERRLGNCRGVMGAFGAALKPSQFSETDDFFVAAACACASPEKNLVESLLRDDRGTEFPEQTALVLSELCRRILRASKGERLWKLVLDVVRLSLAKVGEEPEIREVATMAMVGHVQRWTDATAMAHLPKHSLPELVCVGRSNAGKSSLVNALLGRKALAPISSDPGRTRRFVFYKVNKDHFDPNFVLVDVPGSGFAAPDPEHGSAPKVDTWRSLTDRYLRKRDNLSAVLHLVDSRRACQGQLPKADLDTLDLCAAANRDRAIASSSFLHAVVLTKIDRLSPKQRKKAIETVANTLKDRAQLLPILLDDGCDPATPNLPVLLPAQREHTVPLLLSSATKKQGQTALWLTIASSFASTQDDPQQLPQDLDHDDDDLIAFK